MLVESDMSLIDLKLSEKEITDMTRYDLKNEVKKRTREAAMEYLMTLKGTKSKMDGIEYSGPFDLQPYLQSSLFTREESSLLLALRTRSVRGVRSDYGEMYPDKTCPLIGCLEPRPTEGPVDFSCTPDADNFWLHALLCKVVP